MDIHEKTKSRLKTVTGIFLLIFVGVSLVGFYRNQHEPPVQTGETVKPTEPAVQKEPEQIRSFPKGKIGRWNLLGAAAIAGEQEQAAALYPLKANFTVADFASISAQLGLAKSPTYENHERIYTGRDAGRESAVLYLQKQSGAFVYRATDGIAVVPTGLNQPEPQRMQQFVNRLIGDPIVRLTQTYQDSQDKSIIKYEFHRDQKLTRLPVVNLMGLFNIPAGKTLSDIIKPDNMADKPSGASFNSLVVGTREGRIISIVSALRFPNHEVPVNNESLVPYIEAVRKLDANQYSDIRISPIGGVPSYNELYPSETAELRSVTVTDSILAYLEEIPNAKQTVLVPYYVFRGYGVLSSGYQVNVLATVAAVEQEDLSAPPERSRTAPSSAPEKSAPTGVPAITTKCLTPPLVTDLRIPQRGKDGLIYGQLVRKETVSPWYVVSDSLADVVSLSDSLAAFERDYLKVTREYEQAAGYGCPRKIAGTNDY